MEMPDFSKRIVYRVDGSEQVTVARSLCYKQEPGRALHMDVYASRELVTAARLPAVFLVHGGPIPIDTPSPRSWGNFQSYGELLASSGLVGVTFEHRLHTLADYPQSQTDLMDAIAYLRAHADTYHVDPDRIAVWLFSGAGPLLSWALRDHPSYLRCAAVFYGLLDLEHLMPPNADASMSAAVQALSPRTYLGSEAPSLPLFIARAGLDTEMINKGLDRFVAAALASNASLSLINHSRGEHSFDVLNDDDDSRNIVRSAVRFLRRALLD
jgi:acetyl esterase/lipase